jgi:hypothetical protein
VGTTWTNGIEHLKHIWRSTTRGSGQLRGRKDRFSDMLARMSTVVSILSPQCLAYAFKSELISHTVPQPTSTSTQTQVPVELSRGTGRNEWIWYVVRVSELHGVPSNASRLHLALSSPRFTTVDFGRPLYHPSGHIFRSSKRFGGVDGRLQPEQTHVGFVLALSSLCALARHPNSTGLDILLH